MSTQAVSLPVTAGSIGASVSTNNLQAKKTILVTDITGTLNIEARSAQGGWCTVASFRRADDQVITVAASEMRVNAEGGGGTVFVLAEQGSIRSADVPAPPMSGPGAAVDVTQFGCLTTFNVTGIDGRGAVNIEISGDGINWDTVASFKRVGGCKTKDISAKFVRAVGNGATATIAVSSEEPAVAGSTEPLTSIVYRPEANQVIVVNYDNLVGGPFTEGETVTFGGGSTGVVNTDNGTDQLNVTLTSGSAPLDDETITGALSGATADVNGDSTFDAGANPGGNVYSTFVDAYAAIVANRGKGKVNLEFDARFSTTVLPELAGNSGRVCPVPAGTWDMTDVEWTSHAGQHQIFGLGSEKLPGQILMEDGAIVQNLQRIFGQDMYIYAKDNAVPCFEIAESQFLHLDGWEVRFSTVTAGTAPMITARNPDGSLPVVVGIVSTSNYFGGIGDDRLSTVSSFVCVAPIIEVPAGVFFACPLESGNFYDNMLTGGGFFLNFYGANVYGFMGQGSPGVTFSNPAFTGTVANLFPLKSSAMKIEDPVDADVTAVYSQLHQIITDAPHTVTLPPAGPRKGEPVLVKDVSGAGASVNAISVATVGGDTIDGAAGPDSLTTDRICQKYVSDGGTNWVKC